MKQSLTLLIVLCVQILCAAFFVSGIASSVIGLTIPPINWAIYEWIEIGAALGLLIGVVLSWMLLRRNLRRTERAELKLAELSGAFMDLVDTRFAQWNLTNAERDVALFLIKGMSTNEIAELRGTSEGTIKAQTNSIYKKADVASRAQLVSLFIDDLMHDDHDETTTVDR